MVCWHLFILGFCGLWSLAFVKVVLNLHSTDSLHLVEALILSLYSLQGTFNFELLQLFCYSLASNLGFEFKALFLVCQLLLLSPSLPFFSDELPVVRPLFDFFAESLNLFAFVDVVLTSSHFAFFDLVKHLGQDILSPQVLVLDQLLILFLFLL